MKAFKRIYVEITNRCNMACSFCPQGTKAPRDMTPEEFIRVISEIKDHTNHIYFHVKGEPLLHKDLATFLDICQNHGLMVNLTTNGLFLKSLAPFLAGHPALRKVSLSLQAYMDRGLERVSDYLPGLLKDLDTLRLGGKYTELRMWNQEAGLEADPTTKEVIKILESTYSVTLPLLEISRHNSGYKLADFLYLGLGYTFEWPSLDREIISDRGSCYGLSGQLGILSDGTVVPCCLDGDGHNELGNIFTTPLKDILINPRTQDMIQGFKNKRLITPLCQRCGFAAQKFGS